MRATLTSALIRVGAVLMVVVTLTAVAPGPPIALASRSSAVSAVETPREKTDEGDEREAPSLWTWVTLGGVGLVAALGGSAAGRRVNRRRLERHLDDDQ